MYWNLTAPKATKPTTITLNTPNDSPFQQYKETEPIRVVLNLSSLKANQQDAFICDSNDKNTLKLDSQDFKFDNIFPTNSEQNEMLTVSTIKDLFDGYNQSFITYGKSNSGKSDTLFNEKDGLIRLLFEQLFKKVQSLTADNNNNNTREGNNILTFNFSLSMMEIFSSEKIYDLLSNEYTKDNPILKSLKVHQHDIIENGIKGDKHVKNLSHIQIASLDDLQKWFKIGCQRSSAIINAGTAKEKRSNSIIISKIHLEQVNPKDQLYKLSTLSFIDLYGIDKFTKKDIQLTNDEMKKLNTLMSSFQNLITTLSDPKSLPYTSSLYKDSALNKILQDYIGGNSKTTFIIPFPSPSIIQHEELIEMLKFAMGLKSIKNPLIMNVFGLNLQKQMLLFIKSSKLREENCQTKINYLQSELALKNKLLEPVATDHHEENYNDESSCSDKETIMKLKLKIESLEQVLEHISTSENPKSKTETNEHDELLKKLMDKCEDVAKLQVEIEAEKNTNSKLKQDLKYSASKQHALETMNLKLLEQLQNQEKECKELLISEERLKRELASAENLKNSKAERIVILERAIKDYRAFEKQNTILDATRIYNHTT
ncbi:Smy1p NDAI_0C00480 [Naumovozyma dairenensis CBS 421]|uniref:Kinesin motor domain-containing protein n=1 Tax=Naumovozyma dairenensis (strain ATCC 10597 / BCRC 20456 / CBS 421 / NBRC 0211 / NRRL Y-12639) TaxID=1071378 RepID=G0W7E8_NAUDC|nr:hypothetical protein NDAI_0C00480 [Naumovozyma dairenensis CBS 421]CCD23709.1 hypothetical protein NDAI_0C00480 [Naumovozyma dairenensis CBS 421]